MASTMLNKRAVLSFVLGLSALLLHFLAAVPALVFGLYGLREINRSEGSMRGRYLCMMGMILGAAILVVDVLAIAAYAILLQRNKSYVFGCQYNLQQIGMAAAGYHVDHEAFPPGTVPNAELPVTKRLSWYASILPYYTDMEARRRQISRENTFYFPIDSGIDRTLAWNAPENRKATEAYLQAFICPGHPRMDELPPAGPTYYVGIAGLGMNSASLPLADPHCGMFGYDRAVTTHDISRGESYTVMVCETACRPGPWARGGFDTVRGIDPDHTPLMGPGRPFGGLHPGITNLLMADGHAEPFRDDADEEAFTARATLRAP